MMESLPDENEETDEPDPPSLVRVILVTKVLGNGTPEDGDTEDGDSDAPEGDSVRRRYQSR